MSVSFFVVDAEGTQLAPEGFVQEYETDEYGTLPVNQNPWDMNVANGNFCRIMSILGLSTDDCCGSWNDGSLQFVQGKLTFTLDSIKAMPELDSKVEDSVEGNWVDCGLREGYMQERLSTLLAIVNAAIEKEGKVVFC